MKKTWLKRGTKQLRKLRKDKGSLRLTADAFWVRACIKKWGQNCEVCRKPANNIHHFFPKGSFARLRYEISNGVPLCASCHIGHHWRGDPKIHQAIVYKRGKKWYDKLVAKSKEEAVSINRVGWYEENIEKLKKYQELEIKKLGLTPSTKNSF